MVKGKILFDLGHGEDRLDALTNRLPEEGFLYDIVKDTLTLDKLEKYSVLALSNPKDRFSNFEFKDIAKYVNSGGSLLLTAYFEDEYDFENFYDNMKVDGESFIKSVLGADLHYKKLYPTFSVEIKRSVYYSAWGGFVYDSNFLDYIEIPNDLVNIRDLQATNHIVCKGIAELSSSLNRDYLFSFNVTNKSCEPIFFRPIEFWGTYEWFKSLAKEKFNWPDFSRESEKMIREIVENELKKFEVLGVVNKLSDGLAIGICGDLFEDKYIKNQKENDNLKFALNIFEWLGKPSKYRLRKEERKPKRRLHVIYYP